ncbi:endonuclease domain-containing protein [Nonomuraea sp. NPDC049684]|uniref:endonuclease domain-containing protein n=1 Tax=unclassified Nonomuraea TaxID=2593643 RepID=UPI0037B7905E
MPSWAELPIGQVVRLDADPDALAPALDPLPDDAPAVVTYFAAEERSVADLAASVLRELDKAAIALFPAWLPGAEGVEGPSGVNVAAVRALALRRASVTGHFGPFLAELARRALTGGPSGLAPEVRAAGLARVLADSFGRARLAVLVRVPDGLGAAARDVLVAGCEWLAHRGRAGVWLTGAPLHDDRVRTIATPITPNPLPAPLLPANPLTPNPLTATPLIANSLTANPSSASPAATGPLPAVAGGVREAVLVPATADRAPAVAYPPVAGRPHPGSASELALEAALSGRAWAGGRAWNQTYRPGPLAVPIRVDLLWERERCVVEIDGPDHRAPAKFAADRQRDVLLQLDGYAVLRFPDAQVMTDMDTVVRQIGQFLRNRRRAEG